jgi:protein-disulfide isomerase
VFSSFLLLSERTRDLFTLVGEVQPTADRPVGPIVRVMPPGSDRGDSLGCVANTKRVHRLTRAAVSAVVLVLAVVADLMLCPDPTARAAQAEAIRVTSSNLITDPGTGQPTVVLSMYEDALCPYCRRFEHTFGATVDKLIDSGAVAADYYMVAILDRPGRDYSSRAGAGA